MTLNLREWHHGYLGILLGIIGWVGGWGWVSLAGAVVFLDDVLQHSVQLLWDITWASPLHRLFAAAAARWPWLLRVSAWLDRLVASITR